MVRVLQGPLFFRVYNIFFNEEVCLKKGAKMSDYKNASLNFYKTKLDYLVDRFYEKDFEDDVEKFYHLEFIKKRANEIIKSCELLQDKLDS